LSSAIKIQVKSALPNTFYRAAKLLTVAGSSPVKFHRQTFRQGVLGDLNPFSAIPFSRPFSIHWGSIPGPIVLYLGLFQNVGFRFGLIRAEGV
jgi:hypothetical protein